jgi:hypothetical protein
MHISLATLPTGALIALGVLALAELALDVVALVSLYRRPAASVTLPSKWIWVAIIVLVNLIGAILYFAVGRKPVPAADQGARSATRGGRSATEIADALYGEKAKDAKAGGEPKP